MRIAFVFPGQGSHRPGTLARWVDHPAARILDDLHAGAGRDLVELGEDPEAGRRTADAQPAILAVSLVAWQALVDEGVQPQLVAGHSLGEVSAAIAAGALPVREGARLVATRGAAMGRACQQNPGTMAAVVKLAPETVDTLAADVDGLVVANDNAPGQVVVAGPPEAVDGFGGPVREAGGRLVPLDVEGAFHSPAMTPAVHEVAEVVADTTFTDPLVPLVSGTSAQALDSAEAIGRALVDGILSPVRWREVQLVLAAAGVTHLVEVGPGGVLAGLARRTVPDLAVHTVAGPEDLGQAVATLGTRAVR